MLGSSTSIDPDDLDESSQTDIEDYICCICQLIPNPQTALEEENCGHIFCDICIKKWMEKNDLCPFCKEKITTRLIKDKNKIVYRHLINLLIKCPKENCNWKGTNKDYFEHLKTSHNEIIPENMETNESNYELYKYYKSTTHNHPLKYLDTTMDNGWGCDGRNLPSKCLSGITDFHQTTKLKRFRCMQCDYDLCIKCMNKYYDNKYLIKNDNSNNRALYLINKPYHTQVHQHPLIFIDKTSDNGWACNGKDLSNRCFSGITGFYQSQGIPRFRCEKCDFDLCENCVNFYRKKKFYEMHQPYKAGCHSHGLVYLGKAEEDNWLCDGRKFKEGCFSGFNNFKQTKGSHRFRCDKCDFDLCGNCMDYYYTTKGCIIF